MFKPIARGKWIRAAVAAVCLLAATAIALNVLPDSGSQLATAPTPSEKALSELHLQANLEVLLASLPENSGLDGLKKHFQEIEKAAAFQEPVVIEYELGPTASQEKAQLIKSRYEENLKIFQGLGLKSIDIHWVIASEKDHDWWANLRIKQIPNYSIDVWDTKANMLGHCQLSADIFCGAGNIVEGKMYQDNVLGTEFIDRGLGYVTRHEATHFYQSSIGFIDTCWFTEGQASFFEVYLEPMARSRDQVISRLMNSPTNVASSTAQELERKLNRNSICDVDPDIRYDLGMLVFEYLYQEYSVKTIHDLLVETNANSWESATKDILGISSSELNAGIAQYLFTQFN